MLYEDSLRIATFLFLYLLRAFDLECMASIKPSIFIIFFVLLEVWGSFYVIALSHDRARRNGQNLICLAVCKFLDDRRTNIIICVRYYKLSA